MGEFGYIFKVTYDFKDGLAEAFMPREDSALSDPAPLACLLYLRHKWLAARNGVATMLLHNCPVSFVFTLAKTVLICRCLSNCGD